jgi:hypothetical protein
MRLGRAEATHVEARNARTGQDVVAEHDPPGQNEDGKEDENERERDRHRARQTESVDRTREAGRDLGHEIVRLAGISAIIISRSARP